MTLELAIAVLLGAGVGAFVQGLLDRRLIRGVRELAIEEGRVAERLREIGQRR